MFDLTGKRALVTGASGAIGAAIAGALAAQGAQVGLSGTRTAALETLAAEIGPAARVLPANLGEPGGPEALAERATAELGGVHILVNNAGITRDQLVLRMSDEDWNTVLDIDLSAPFRLTRALLRGMVKQRWGRIIGITSVVAATGSPGQTNYAAAKAGMIGMTKALAHEVASRGITANCVAPGFIESDMTAGLAGGAQAGDPRRRAARPLRQAGGCRRLRRFSRQRRGIIRHRSDVARQRRHGDGRMSAFHAAAHGRTLASR